jgi:hypothetical protein
MLPRRAPCETHETYFGELSPFVLIWEKEFLIVSVSSSYAHSYVGGFKFPTVTRPDFFFSIGKMLRRGGRSKLVGVQQQQHQRQLLKTSAKRTKMKGNEGRREMMMTVWPCRRPNHRTPADDTLGLVSPCNNHARCVYTYIFDVCCNIPDTSVFFSPLQQQWRPINDGGEFF